MKENPADISTQGMKIYELASSTLWWNGPSFLAETPSTWPMSITEAPSDVTKREEKSATAITFLVRDLKLDDESKLQTERFSSLQRLVNVMARVSRFAENCRKTLINERTFGDLTLDKIHDSEVSLISMLQANLFKTEVASLKSGNQ